MPLPRLIGSAVVAVVVVAACAGPTPAGTNATTITQTPGVATPTPGSNPTPAVVTTPAPVGGTVDTCTLLTAADVSAATGVDNYAEGVSDEIGGCTWNLEGLSNNQGDLVYLAIQELDLASVKTLFANGGVDATVSGHAAFYNPTEGLGSMWVDIGAHQVLVLSFPQSNDLDPSYQQIAIQLAEIALGNM